MQNVSLVAILVWHFLAPQSGALKISAYRDFLPSHPIPSLPLIAFDHDDHDDQDQDHDHGCDDDHDQDH